MSEAFLNRVDVGERSNLLAALIALERKLFSDFDNPPRLSDFLRRFPDDVLAVRIAFGEFNKNPPSQSGRYRIVEFIGRGSCGVVYRACDDTLPREVAIKITRASRMKRPTDADLQYNEARTVARLDHPGIVPICDVERTPEGLPYIVSKYIEGPTLAHEIKTNRPAR